MARQKLISIIVPIYNEAPNIPFLYDSIIKHIGELDYAIEFIFVDDGSSDDSPRILNKAAKNRKNIRFIELSRNFGKEAAVSAGLHAAKGDAAIILDADLQHPPELLKEFIQKWEDGADVVIGIKHYGKHEGQLKKISSNIFYKMLGSISNTPITPHACDYRLIDRRVINAFNEFSERNRMTRGLIDWLGFKRDYVNFVAPPRFQGKRKYSWRKLVVLAMDNFTSYSLIPLKLAGYIGSIILVVSGIVGIFVFFEQILLNDPLHLHVTGTAMLALMLLFLVGIVLACLGLIALYIAHIHDEVVNRPLYVIRNQIDSQFDEEEISELEGVSP